jgi:two-component system catabolic regulation response regulator CreB
MDTILIIEDEPAIADTVVYALESEGFRTRWVRLGTEGVEILHQEPVRLVVLDVGLPDGSGFEFCKTIRSFSDVPVVFLTARSDEVDRVVGLEIGADDYVVKPFSPRVLVARARALLRRATDAFEGAEQLRVGPIEVDSGRHEVRVDGEPLELTHTEFRILRFLTSRPGRVRARHEILETIGERNVLERTVDVHVAKLRKKLGRAGELLETVRGVGYRLRG